MSSNGLEIFQWKPNAQLAAGKRCSEVDLLDGVIDDLPGPDAVRRKRGRCKRASTEGDQQGDRGDDHGR